MYHVDPFLRGSALLELLVFAALVLVVAWGIALLYRREHRHADSHIPPQAPLSVLTPQPTIDAATQILRERFARGEISEIEFLSASRALGAPPQPSSPSGGPLAGPSA